MIAMQIFLTTTAASEGVDVLGGSYKYKHGENALFICLIVLLVIRLFSHIDSYFIHPHSHRFMDTVGNGVCIEGVAKGGLVIDTIWCVLNILVDIFWFCTDELIVLSI